MESIHKTERDLRSVNIRCIVKHINEWPLLNRETGFLLLQVPVSPTSFSFLCCVRVIN